MLSPKRVKFRKMFKGRTKGIASRGATVTLTKNGQSQRVVLDWLTGHVAVGP